MNAGRDALRANGRPSFMTILLTGCVISGIVTGVLGFLMHVEVNSNLPEADRLPWTRRFRPSVSELSSLYDKLYQLSDFFVQSSAHATTKSMSIAGGALPYYPARG
jgi:hypothetical protein